ncbi:BrnA antitoxin family protein [Treponema parvum]|uniref:BrnA antitoxin family protein n=2 Tax=Treponema parvum TaxID=138851 RepID=A0A975F2G1_9SPIR|nr:BrnA antitoxin family protein [Treponema parvum]QTQ15134.1 BrnA antitoxin family protein [Treponema parvum]QTQ17383.1 BrnA antitoxin family protein [Treponema parvum]
MNLEKIIAECEKNSIPDNQIDFSDIPEITDFTGFKPRYPQYFKPKREQVSIRLSKYLVDHFKAMGKGWQTKLNDFLMEAVNKGLI